MSGTYPYPLLGYLQAARRETDLSSYAIFLIPSQIIITRVRPSLWLPLLEFGWGVLTLSLFKVHDAKQVYAIRAFMGAFEASAYPGALMLLMSWYTPREIALRIGFYHSCQSST